MSKKNGTLESAIQERLDANPEVRELNEKGMEIDENYHSAKKAIEKLEAKKDRLTLDEQSNLEALYRLASKLEKTIEESRKAIAETNKKVMDSGF